MSEFWVILLIACLASCAPSNQKENASRHTQLDRSIEDTARQSENKVPQFLIFEFPDGVRGGIGRFLGTADLSSGMTENATELLRNCGAVNPQTLNVWSHQTHVATQSTENDRVVIQCFLRATSRHFNVGIASDPTLRTSQLDSSRFEDLQNNLDRKRFR